MIKIAPSTNPISENNLVEYALELQTLGADYLHCDVMDGKFVSATCLSAKKIKEINLNSLIQLDVHLMIELPLKTLKNYIKTNPNIITLHIESFKRPESLLQALTQIKKAHILCGLSIKPETPLESIYPYLPLLDLVLIMSVEPGKSGQKLIENSINRIEALKKHIVKNNYNIIIEVDGGVNKENVRNVASAGADMVVMGSAIANAENREDLINFVHSL